MSIQQRMNPFGMYLTKEDYIVYGVFLELPWFWITLGKHFVFILRLFCFLFLFSFCFVFASNSKLEVQNFIFIPEEKENQISCN